MFSDVAMQKAAIYRLTDSLNVDSVTLTSLQSSGGC